MPPSKRYDPPPAAQLETLHIDADLIVANKPSGLLSVPGLGPEKAICANSQLSDRHGPVLTIHRLDMDTSGLIVFARHKEAQRAMSRQFELRQVEKAYEALVEGCLEPVAGTIDKAIARHSLNRPLRHLDPEGQAAITHWTVIETGRNQTRVRLRPETGRSHQLRLHLASQGHPILGDVFYGDPDSAPRLCLHAKALRFAHPTSGENLSFSSATPF